MRRLAMLCAVSTCLLLSACSQGHVRYCKAEQRIIPELEWKARALVALRKTPQADDSNFRPRFPKNMQEFIAAELPNGVTDAKVQAVLIKYIEQNPLCCQIDYNDASKTIDTYLENTSPRIVDRNGYPVANLYVFDGEESKFQPLEKLLPQNFNLLDGAWNSAAVGITACGDKVIIWDRG